MEDITLIGRNEHDYYTATGNKSCVLLATLNILKGTYGVNTCDLNDIIQRWSKLVAQDEEKTFVFPIKIPLTIEQITGGAFFGRIIGKNFSKLLRERGISERYALDSDHFDASMLPSIYIEKIPDNGFGHAMAVLGFDAGKGYHLIDDGKPIDVKVLSSQGLVYKIERN